MKTSSVVALALSTGAVAFDSMHLFYQNCGGTVTPTLEVLDGGNVQFECDLFQSSPNDMLCFTNGFVPHIFASANTGCNGNKVPTDSEVAVPGVGGWHIWYPHNSTNCKSWSSGCDGSADCVKTGWECDLTKGDGAAGLVGVYDLVN